MDEPTSPLPERVESRYRDRRVWPSALMVVVVGLQGAVQLRYLIGARQPAETFRWVFLGILVACLLVMIVALVAQWRGYRVVVDRRGIRRTGWPSWDLPWEQIARVDRMVLRDKGLLMVQRRGGKRTKGVRLELADMDAAYALASAMTSHAAVSAPAASQTPSPVPPLPTDGASPPRPVVHSEDPAARLIPMLFFLATIAVLAAIPLAAVALTRTSLGPVAFAVGGGLLVLTALMWPVMWWFTGAHTTVVDADAVGFRITTLGRTGRQLAIVDVPWDDVALLRTRLRGAGAQYRVTRRFNGKRALAWGRLDPATLPTFEALARAHGVQVTRDA